MMEFHKEMKPMVMLLQDEMVLITQNEDVHDEKFDDSEEDESVDKTDDVTERVHDSNDVMVSRSEMTASVDETTDKSTNENTEKTAASVPVGCESATSDTQYDFGNSNAPNELHQILACGTCDMICRSSVELMTHMKSHKTSEYLVDQKPLVCSICKKIIPLNDIAEHHKTHTSSMEEKLCWICGLSCMNLASLKNHLEVHKVQKPKFSIAVSKSGDSRSTHVIHTEILYCGYCSSRFTSPHGLKEHLYLRCVRCPIPITCRNPFSLLAGMDFTKLGTGQERVSFLLTRKEEIKLNETGIPKKITQRKPEVYVQCKICSKYFLNINRHMKTAHAAEGLNPNRDNRRISILHSSAAVNKKKCGMASSTASQAPCISQPKELTVKLNLIYKNADNLKVHGSTVVEPNQGHPREVITEPNQKNPDDALDEPNQRLTSNVNATPNQLHASNVSARPNQLHTSDINARPNQLHTSDINARPNQLHTSNVNAWPKQLHASNVIVEPSQDHASNVMMETSHGHTSNNSLTLSLNQDHTGDVIQPNQSLTSDVNATPNQLHASDINALPNQLHASDIHAVPNQLHASNVNALPNQFHASNVNARPNQLHASDVIVEPSQDHASNVITSLNQDHTGYVIQPNQNKVIEQTSHYGISIDKGKILEHQKNNLKYLHNAEGIIICDICNKMYTKQKSLDLHKQLIHGIWVESAPKHLLDVARNFRCEICDKIYTTPSSLNCHRRLTHGFELVKRINLDKEGLQSDDSTGRSLLQQVHRKRERLALSSENKSCSRSDHQEHIFAKKTEVQVDDSNKDKEQNDEEDANKDHSSSSDEGGNTSHVVMQLDPVNFDTSHVFLTKNGDLQNSDLEEDENGTSEHFSTRHRIIQSPKQHGSSKRLCRKIKGAKDNLDSDFEVSLDNFEESDDESFEEYEPSKKSSRKRPRSTRLEHRYVCDFCGKQFAQQQKMERHKQWFHADEVSKKSKQTGLRHRNERVPEDSGEKSRKRIEKTEIEKSHINDLDHHRNWALELADDYMCDICHKIFVNKKNIKWHKKQFHAREISEQSKSVEQRDKSEPAFEHPINIKKEILEQPEADQMNQPTGPVKRPICDICGMLFSCPRNVKRHKKRLHKREFAAERRHARRSAEANRSGNRQSSLFTPRVNLFSGLGNRPVCDICNKVFSCQKNVNRHKRNVHAREFHGHGRYHDKQHVKSHIANSHRMDGSTGLVGTLICDICNKKFSCSRNVRRHKLAVHAREPHKEKKWAKQQGVHAFINSAVRTISEPQITNQRIKSEAPLETSDSENIEQPDSDSENIAQDESEIIIKSSNPQRTNQSTGLVSDLVCDICKKIFSCPRNVRRHRQTVHAREIREQDKLSKQPCNTLLNGPGKDTSHEHNSCMEDEICEQTGTMERSMSDVENTEEDEIENIELDQNKTTKQSHNLQQTSPMNDVVCDICDKVFSHAKNVKRHKLTVHAREVCEQANPTKHGDVSSEDMKQDKNESTEKSSYSHRINQSRFVNELMCDICHKIFSSSKNVKRHRLTVHAKELRERRRLAKQQRENALVNTDGTNISDEHHTDLKDKSKEKSVCTKICAVQCTRLSDNQKDRNKLHARKLLESAKTTRQTRSRHLLVRPYAYGSGVQAEQISEVFRMADKFKCDICGKLFAYKKNMKWHTKKFHANELQEMSSVELPKEYTCVVKCIKLPSNRSFHAKKLLERARRTKQDNSGQQIMDQQSGFANELRCDICGKLFTFKKSVKRHKLTFHAKELREQALSAKRHVHGAFKCSNARYVCDICGQNFSHPQNMKRHKLRFHATELRKHAHQSKHSQQNLKQMGQSKGLANELMCDICNKVFSHRKNVRRHRLTVHARELQKRKRRAVGHNSRSVHIKETITSSNMHRVSQVTKYVNECMCDICNKIFSLPKNVRRHKLTVHANELKEERKSATQHDKSQDVERNATENIKQSSMDQSTESVNECVCHVCNKTFSSPSNVKRHKQTVHTRDSLEKHSDLNENSSASRNPEHTENEDINDSTSFEQRIESSQCENECMCEICNKMFSSARNVKRHKQTVHAKELREKKRLAKQEQSHNAQVNPTGKMISDELNSRLKVEDTAESEYVEQNKDDDIKGSSSFNQRNQSSELVNDCVCYVCNKMFSSPRNVKRHRQTVHARESHDYHRRSSEKCQEAVGQDSDVRSCASSDKLNRSVRLVNEFVCDICDQVFVHQSSVKRHIQRFHASQLSEQNAGDSQPDSENMIQNEQPDSENMIQNEQPDSENMIQNEQPDSENMIQNEQPDSENVMQNEQPDSENMIQNEQPDSENEMQNEQPDSENMIQNVQPDIENRIQNEQPDSENVMQNKQPDSENVMQNEQPDSENMIQNEQPDSENRIQNEQPDSENVMQNEQPDSENVMQNEQPDGENRIQNEQPDSENVMQNEQPDSENVMQNEQPDSENVMQNEQPDCEKMENECHNCESLLIDQADSENTQSKHLDNKIMQNEHILSENKLNEQPDSENMQIEYPDSDKMQNHQPVSENVQNDHPFSENMSNEPDIESMQSEQPDSENMQNERPDNKNIENDQPNSENIENDQPVSEKIENEQPDIESMHSEHPDSENDLSEQPYSEKI